MPFVYVVAAEGLAIWMVTTGQPLGTAHSATASRAAWVLGSPPPPPQAQAQAQAQARQDSTTHRFEQPVMV
jgi:hypothetical protein